MLMNENLPPKVREFTWEVLELINFCVSSRNLGFHQQQ